MSVRFCALGEPACGAGGVRAARTHPVVQIVVHGAGTSGVRGAAFVPETYRQSLRRCSLGRHSPGAPAPSSVLSSAAPVARRTHRRCGHEPAAPGWAAVWAALHFARVRRAMRAAGAALLALAAVAPGSHAQAVAAGNATSSSNGTGTAAASLPPHTGAPGGLRPLILFHESFFGRDFVHREYAFEARRPRTRCGLGASLAAAVRR